MALKKKKKTDVDNDTENEQPTTLDRLTDLRMDITEDQSAVARLLDIMIDNEGGDSAAVHADIESARRNDEDGDENTRGDVDDTTAGSPAG